MRRLPCSRYLLAHSCGCVADGGGAMAAFLLLLVL